MDELEVVRERALHKARLSEIMAAEPSPAEPWSSSAIVRDDYVTEPQSARHAPRPNVAHHVARVRQIMVEMLVDQPTVNLLGPGFRSLMAGHAGLEPGTLSNWFTHSGTSLRKVVHDLLTEAIEEAMRMRAAQDRVNSSTHA